MQGLIIRNHPSSLPLARRLFTLFGDGTLAPHAAKRLGLLPDLAGSVLNKRFHAIVKVRNLAVIRIYRQRGCLHEWKLLFAQRMFGTVAPEIKGAITPELGTPGFARPTFHLRI